MIEAIALAIILIGAIYFYNKPCHNCIIRHECKQHDNKTGCTFCDNFDIDYPKGETKNGN